MSINLVSPGSKAPQEVNVVIEIAAHAGPVKYEVCKDTGAIHVDRFLSTAMHYPCHYGFVPQTLCGDGDPADVLVVSPYQLVVGCVIACRPIGMLTMEDEKGEDNKIIAVPSSDVTELYDNAEDIDDVPESLCHQIKHFFERYKDLEPKKWVKVQSFQGKSAAIKELESSIQAYASNG